MRPPKKINKMLKELNFPAGRQLDRKITLELQNIKTKHCARETKSWRIIMNRKFIPASAVAAIIIIAVIYLSFSG